MRIFARRERPHPGAQLTLFEAEDGWRYTLWVTNLPRQVCGWRGQLAYIDAAHRVHARVEDAIRTGKDCGIGKYTVALRVIEGSKSGLTGTEGFMSEVMQREPWNCSRPRRFPPGRRAVACAPCQLRAV